MPGSADRRGGFDEALRLIRDRAATTASRLMIAVAGPPGAGKSSLSEPLRAALGDAAVVPMDGFHFDDSILEQRGHRGRKGAPHTFDVDGFASLLARLREGGRDVAVPVFDRKMELSRGSARIVPASARYVIVEGNYLLLDLPPWDALSALFDVSFFIDVPLEELDRRLMARWFDLGFDPLRARAWIDANDRPNIATVLEHRLPADLTLNLAALPSTPGWRGGGGR